MAQELKAYNVVATVNVNPDVVDNLGCTEFAAYDADEVDAVLAEKDKEIAELKAKLQDHCSTCPVKEQEEDVLAEKDAEIRRLKRALWLARAERAKDRAMTCGDFDYLDDTERDMNMALARTWMTCRLLKSSEWLKVWKNVERKCRAKAEAYK